MSVGLCHLCGVDTWHLRSHYSRDIYLTSWAFLLLSSSFGVFSYIQWFRRSSRSEGWWFNSWQLQCAWQSILGKILTQAAVCASITETEVRVCAVGAQVEEKSTHLKNIHEIWSTVLLIGHLKRKKSLFFWDIFPAWGSFVESHYILFHYFMKLVSYFLGCF